MVSASYISNMKWVLLLGIVLNVFWHVNGSYYTSTTTIPCDPVYLDTNSGSFTSPNYPDDYNNNQECTWRITVEEGRKIVLKISDIHIETCSSCTCDVLEIYDGVDSSAPLLAEICYDSGNSTTITSSSNVLYVVFSTDASVTKTGFKAEYKATCLERSLMTNGDVAWFNFFDTPKGSPVENALLGSGKVYSGATNSDVTFTVEGKKLKKFILQGVLLLSRYAKQVKYTFVYNVKKPKQSKTVTKKIKNVSKWTPLKLKKQKKKMQRLLITLTRDSSTKVQVRGMKVTVCS